MTLKIETGTDNEILRTKSKPIPAVTGELRALAADMMKTMEEADGVGLAAPQVGLNVRMVICRLNVGEKSEMVLPLVNPQIMFASEQTEKGEEGCLSIPKVWAQIERSKTVILRFRNLKGQEQTLELNGFNARIVQHEIDHLDGILFIDRAEGTEKSTKADEVEKI